MCLASYKMSSADRAVGLSGILDLFAEPVSEKGCLPVHEYAVLFIVSTLFVIGTFHK